MNRVTKVGVAVTGALVLSYHAIKAWFMAEPKKKSPNESPVTLLGTVLPKKNNE